MTTNLDETKRQNQEEQLNVAETNKFLCLQTDEFQALYKEYCDMILAETGPSMITQRLSTVLINSYGYDNTESIKIAKMLQETFSSKTFNGQFYDTPIEIDSLSGKILPREEPHIFITSVDYQRYVEMITADADATADIKALLLSFVIFYRKNYHPRGWSKYDKKNIFYLAGISKMPIYTQEKLTNYLHIHYNLNMQVIGSNQPMACFNLPWLGDQPPVNSEFNPFVNLGTLTPQTIRQIVSKIQA